LVGLGGVTADKRMKHGRKHCASCGKWFAENEAKSTKDFVHYYCVSCDDERRRVSVIVKNALVRVQ
jgi:hypothetical protein